MLRGLHFKLALIVAVGALLLASGSSLWLYQRSYQASLQDSQRSLQQLLATVQSTAAIAAYVGNAELAQQVLDGLRLHDVVLGAEIVDQASVASEGAAGFRLRAGSFVDGDRDRALVHVLPHPFEPGEQAGLLRVLPNQALIEQHAGAGANTATIGLAAHTFMVAFLVLIVVYLMLTKPLVRLSSGLHGIVPGEKARLHSPSQHRQDELGKLVGDINRLLDTVENKFAEERNLRQRVEALEQRFRGIFEGSSAGICLLRESGVLLTANPAFYRTVRHEERELAESGSDAIARIFAEPAQVHALIATVLQAKRPASGDLRLRREEDGLPVWVHALFSPSAHVPGARMVEGVIYDITERKRVEESARQRAEQDVLTGLPNRHAVELRLSEQISAALERRENVVLMLVDLDRFKPINDTHGHEAGDQVLIEVARRLRSVVRSTDMVARLGGDEFLILLGNRSDSGAAMRIAGELVAALHAEIELTSELRVQIGASIGLAWFPEHAVDPESLRAAADAAMYAVKRAGRDGYALYRRDGQHTLYLRSPR